jgi:hypothetical protein
MGRCDVSRLCTVGDVLRCPLGGRMPVDMKVADDV